MVAVNIVNIVASTTFAEKLDLNIIAESIDCTDYKPNQFPGLIFRLNNPKTATLLFTSGKANCTGSKSIEEIRRAIDLIANKLQKIGLHIFDKKDLHITVQNIVATANLGGELNLSEVALSLGLQNIEYEPEQFPGLVYHIQEPKVVILLFSSGKIVCTGGRNIESVSLAIENLIKELIASDLFLK